MMDEAGPRGMSTSAAALVSPTLADPARTKKGLLRKEGEYWTVGYGGRVFRLKDTKGLACLAQLLRFPGTDVHALDLVGGTAQDSESREDETNRFAAAALPQSDEELESAGIHVGGLGDAGEVLDEPAKAAYRGRLIELHAEVAEAKRLDQVARAEQAEEEIAALLAELSRAVGLGGRDRRAASKRDSCTQDGGEKNCRAGTRTGRPVRAVYQDGNILFLHPRPCLTRLKGDETMIRFRVDGCR